MGSWNEYKKTMRAEPDAFALARSGERDALLAALSAFGDLERKNASGYSLLMLACYRGHPEAAEALLNRGADPDTCDNAGNTALMGAAFKGELAVVRLLCERGADPARRNRSGQNALDVALMFGRSEAAAELAARLRAPHRPVAGFLAAWGAALAEIFTSKRRTEWISRKA